MLLADVTIQIPVVLVPATATVICIWLFLHYITREKG